MTGAPLALASPREFSIVGAEAVRLMGAKAAIVFSRIVYRTVGDEPWAASMSLLAAETGLTEGEVRRAVSSLIDSGYIHVAQDSGYDRTNNYLPIWTSEHFHQHQRADAPIEDKTPTKRATRRSHSVPYPDDFEPTPANLETAKRRGVDPYLELERFKSWALAKDARYVLWSQAFNTWLLRAVPAQPAGRVVPFRPRPRPSDGIDY